MPGLGGEAPLAGAEEGAEEKPAEEAATDKSDGEKKDEEAKPEKPKCTPVPQKQVGDIPNDVYDDWDGTYD